MVSAEQLIKLHIDQKWTDPLNATFERFNILTPNQQASFIGQCGHECANFKVLEENLNYKAATLMRLWPKRFPTLEVANEYAGNPKRIANMVYASRMGNRDAASGDGFRFRGRGAIQTTGYAGYFHAGKALGIDFVMNPDLVATPQYAALTAGFFWDTQKLNRFADSQDYVAMTKKINGGTIGLEDRKAHISTALAVLST
ncbi:COG3179 Predicted chitinase [uncultured Caudovirales phage]|uniref:COG3179 Predicted chitinase n=1 Tax=uncultured Caudovirales phage TaxID=2100421 RepID=A0A6J5REI1_9CAUD|nr:COG3179 Predicted chitinase [uncultured Caudovirales phage]